MSRETGSGYKPSRESDKGSLQEQLLQEGYSRDESKLLARAAAPMEQVSKELSEISAGLRIKGDPEQLQKKLDALTDSFFDVRSVVDKRRQWEQKADISVKNYYEQHISTLNKFFGEHVVEPPSISSEEELALLAKTGFELHYLPKESAS